MLGRVLIWWVVFIWCTLPMMRLMLLSLGLDVSICSPCVSPARRCTSLRSHIGHTLRRNGFNGSWTSRRCWTSWAAGWWWLTDRQVDTELARRPSDRALTRLARRHNFPGKPAAGSSSYMFKNNGVREQPQDRWTITIRSSWAWDRLFCSEPKS